EIEAIRKKLRYRRFGNSDVEVAEGQQRRRGEAVAQSQIALVVHREHLQSGSTGQGFLVPFMNVRQQLVEVRKTDIDALQSGMQVPPSQRLEVGEQCHQLLRREVEAADVT